MQIFIHFYAYHIFFALPCGIFFFFFYSIYVYLIIYFYHTLSFHLVVLFPTYLPI